MSVPGGENRGFNSHIYFVIRGTDGPQDIRDVVEDNVPDTYKIDRANLPAYLQLAQRFWVSAWE